MVFYKWHHKVNILIIIKILVAINLKLKGHLKKQNLNIAKL